MKIRLLTKLDYQRLISLLKGSQSNATYISNNHQINHFIDDKKLSFRKSRNVLRLRESKTTKNGSTADIYTLTYKCNGNISNGISRIQELEEKITRDEFLNCLKDPFNGLNELSKKIEFLNNGGGLIFDEVCEKETLSEIASFKNTREVFNWKGLCLEVDETTFPFGYTIFFDLI